MTTRSEREKAQKLNEQHQAILSKLLREDDNKYCADCLAKGKRNTHALTSNLLTTYTLCFKTAGSKCVCVCVKIKLCRHPDATANHGLRMRVSRVNLRWHHASFFLLTLGCVIPIKLSLPLLKFASSNPNAFVAHLL